ncbi:MAG: hypothetical protein ACP5SF_05605 [Thermoplasmata archaeon]
MEKLLNDRETIAFMTAYQPNYIIPSNFFAFCKLKLSFDDILNEIIAQGKYIRTGEHMNRNFQRE